MKNNILNSIYSLYKNIDNKRRFQLLIIIILNIINGLLEFTTLAAASFFLEAISNPISAKDQLSFIKLSFNNSNSVVLTATILFITFIILSSLLRIFNLWLSIKFRVSLLVFIEEKIFRNIIHQEFEYHINTSSTNVITDLTKNIDKTGFFIENLLSLITGFILSLSLVIGLLRLSPLITLFCVLLLASLYLFIGINTNKKVNSYSKYELKATKEFLKNIQESIGAIKEIILSRKYDFFLTKYKENSFVSRKYQGLSGYVTTFPRYLFEGIGLTVIGFAGYLVFVLKGSNIIPLLGTFALGAQKLLPSMQTIYRSWQLLYFYDKGLLRILNLLKLKYKNYRFRNNNSLNFNNKITIRNLNFKYQDNENNALSNINLSINKGENIGIMGSTGSGKTTFINILMGLLKPTSGNILIDEIDIFNKENQDLLFEWRRKITHIPQKIYLLNENLIKNIAFGVPSHKIDKDKLKYAIEKASLGDLLKNRKADYNLEIGEDGGKVSGGQKQRIGIARAIYSDLDIVILDESTNALDKTTESKIIENIFNLSNKKTTITISHKEESLALCDRIIKFEEGKINQIIDNKK